MVYNNCKLHTEWLINIQFFITKKVFKIFCKNSIKGLGEYIHGRTLAENMQGSGLNPLKRIEGYKKGVGGYWRKGEREG